MVVIAPEQYPRGLQLCILKDVTYDCTRTHDQARTASLNICIISSLHSKSRGQLLAIALLESVPMSSSSHPRRMMRFVDVIFEVTKYEVVMDDVFVSACNCFARATEERH